MEAPKEIYVDVLAVVNDCSTKISTKPLKNFAKYVRADLDSHAREERIECLAKAVLTLGELGDCRTAAVLNEIRLELKGIND